MFNLTAPAVLRDVTISMESKVQGSWTDGGQKPDTPLDEE